MSCYSRFRATPNEAFSRRAPEQNVWIFPARHAQCDIWVFPHNFTSPLPFPSSMLKVSSDSRPRNFKPCLLEIRFAATCLMSCPRIIHLNNQTKIVRIHGFPKNFLAVGLRYQKHTFIEIDTNFRTIPAIFSNMVFKQNAYY